MRADLPTERALQRQLIVLLLLTPTLCALPLLGLIAPAGAIRWVILGVSSVIALTLIGLAWRTYSQLQALRSEKSQREE